MMNLKKYWRSIVRYNLGEFSREAVKQAKEKAQDKVVTKVDFDSDGLPRRDGRTEIKKGDKNAKQFLSRYNDWLRGYDD